MAGEGIMLSRHVERYVTLRQTLGFELHDAAAHLRVFARFAASRGDTHLRSATAVAWAEQAPSPNARSIRLREVTQFARFLHAEDSAHEVPSSRVFHAPAVRPLPYIYAPEEILRIIGAAGRLRRTYPLRREIYATLLGLIAATGLRSSEALDLRLDDVLSDGVLRIRKTKFGKSRLVPLHPSAVEALGQYLERRRRRFAPTTDHVFLSAGNRRISSGLVAYTFRRILGLAGIARRPRAPRIHDLRHTFATRALERCPTEREAVAHHFVALATYLGHADIANTYWYLQATPELMTHIAAAAERFVTGEDV
jgi:integrase